MKKGKQKDFFFIILIVNKNEAAGWLSGWLQVLSFLKCVYLSIENLNSTISETSSPHNLAVYLNTFYSFLLWGGELLMPALGLAGLHVAIILTHFLDQWLSTNTERQIYKRTETNHFH